MSTVSPPSMSLHPCVQLTEQSLLLLHELRDILLSSLSWFSVSPESILPYIILKKCAGLSPHLINFVTSMSCFFLCKQSQLWIRWRIKYRTHFKVLQGNQHVNGLYAAAYWHCQSSVSVLSFFSHPSSSLPPEMRIAHKPLKAQGDSADPHLQACECLRWRGGVWSLLNWTLSGSLCQWADETAGQQVSFSEKKEEKDRYSGLLNHIFINIINESSDETNKYSFHIYTTYFAPFSYFTITSHASQTGLSYLSYKIILLCFLTIP